MSEFDRTNQSAINYNKGISAYLKDICKPLFDNFGLSLFEYIKIFFDETCLNISTNQEWLIHNYTKCPMGTMIEEHVRRIPVGTTRYIPFGYSERELKNPMLFEAYSFDIWNGLYVYKRYEQECECFVFAANRGKTSIMDFYMNERFLIEKFINYFREKAQPFIDSFDLQKRTILHKKIFRESNFLQEKNDDSKDHGELFQANKFYLNVGESKVQLSRREIQCLCLLSYGQSSKQISDVLGISRRTVESYINILKDKTEKKYRPELIKVFHDYIGTNENMKIFL